jgi:hypothetical protein
MSVHEGKKIVSALEAFNANRLIRADVTSLLTVALRGGGIMPRHIDRLHQALDKEVAALPANFGVVRPREKGVGFIMYGHMVINQDADGSLLHDQYTPNIVSYVMGRQAFERDQVLLPITFNSQHTAFRFIQRTSSALDYKSDEFFMAITHATVMMQALSRKDKPSTPVPMYIPHDAGLFMGYAENMPDDTYLRHTDVAKRHGKRVNTTHIVADEKIQPFIPSMRTVVKTFISKDDMSPNKRAVWEMLGELFKGPENEAAVKTALTTHGIGNHDVSPEQIKNLEILFDKIRTAMESAPWQQLGRHAARDGHLPQRSYKDRLQAANGMHFSL